MKVLLGLSGGVDSAYAASLLTSLGYSVEGCVLVMHEHTDLDSARRAAEELSIPLHEVDCSADFDRIVRSNFVNEYLSGRTPNPCIVCNEHVKFASLYRYATANGFDKIATGHYARISTTSSGENIRYAISRPRDEKKDQSYMLYRLPQEILSSLLLPLGEIVKSDVRKEAESKGISAAKSRDSQEICFLPDGNHAEYVESVGCKCDEGNFVTPDGTVLGTHRGIVRYTVGQRKGLGIALGQRMFVTAIDPVANTVTLSHEIIGKKSIEITDIAYQGLCPSAAPTVLKLGVKVRYSAPIIDAECEIRPDGTATVYFDNNVVTAPGQSAVLYSEGRVMLGGFIG